MATYRVTMILVDDPRRPRETRELSTKIAGCSSEAEAQAKAREFYAPRVAGFKSTKLIERDE